MTRPPRRRSTLRWRRFNYHSVHWYAVTACVEGRRCLLGSVRDGRVTLSTLGRLVERVWDGIPERYPFVVLDARVFMPNHMHAILRFKPVEHGSGVVPASLGDVIRWWKCATTVRARRRGLQGASVEQGSRLWQRGFYDRVLRNDEELNHGRGYIVRNPLMWERDPHHPGGR